MRCPYAALVIYGRYRTLISIVIVLALAIAFVWGSVRVLDSVTGSAAPAPATPTAVVLVEQPSATPIPRATATPRHPLATATPAPTSGWASRTTRGPARRCGAIATSRTSASSPP